MAYTTGKHGEWTEWLVQLHEVAEAEGKPRLTTVQFARQWSGGNLLRAQQHLKLSKKYETKQDTGKL